MAAAILVAAAGLLALLFAAQFAAASFGYGFSPLLVVREAVGGDVIVWSLVALLALLVLCLWLVLPHREARLWLPLEGGGVAIPAALFEGFVERALTAHPEVLRVRVQLTVRGERLCGAATVHLRPLADVERLSRELEAEAAAAVCSVVGVSPERFGVRARVVSVRQLKRYLP